MLIFVNLSLVCCGSPAASDEKTSTEKDFEQSDPAKSEHVAGLGSSVNADPKMCCGQPAASDGPTSSSSSPSSSPLLIRREARKEISKPHVSV